MKKKPLLSISSLITILVLTVLVAGCTTSASATDSTTTGGSGTVTSVTVTDSIETSGSLDADQLAKLTWKTSGIVDEVHVQVGQKVRAGEVLATLKADSVPASIASAQAELVTARRNLEDVKSSNLATAQAQVALAEAQEAYDTAKNKVDGLKYERATPEMIKYAESQLTMAQKAMDKAQSDFNNVSEKPSNDPAYASAYTRLYEAQKAYRSALANLNWYKGQPTDNDVAAIQADFALAKAQLEDAQREWERLKDGPDPSDVAAAQAKVDAAQATVNSMAIIAPFDGEILAVLTSPDNLVEAGEAAVVIVNPDTLKVEALVDESDISRVSVGNSATITMDTLPGTTLTGHVSMIDPIGSSVSGLVKYTVLVTLDPTDISPLFGATTNVTLLTSEPRLMLAVPLGAVATDTSGEYVLRVTANGGVQRVDVVSDSIQGDLVAVTGDLKEGDQVQLITDISTSSSQSDFGGGPGGGPGGVFIP
jgi:HlyD family secretion protein